MSQIQFNQFMAAAQTKAQSRPIIAEQASTASGPNAAPVEEFKLALDKAEHNAMTSALSGADPHAMVQSLANAEIMLDAAVTIRDKVVEAYQELLRMPV